MKKIISVLLAFAFVFSCTAIAFAAQEPTPVVVVSGMGTAPLIDADSGENVFPPSAETIVTNILKAVPSLTAAALLNDWKIFGQYGAEPLHDLFEKMKCDENGDSVYNVQPVSFAGNAGNYPEEFMDDEKTKSSERSVVRAVAEKIGWDRTYFFYYDFRRSALDIADDLKATVDAVLEETGSKKVTFVAMSFGGTVASAFLYKYGSDMLKNIVYASTAVCGTDLVGKLFSGNIEIEIDAIVDYIEEYLIQSGAAYELIGLGSDSLNKYGAAARTAINAYLKAMVEALREPVYAKVFADTFLRFPGIWGLMNADNYDNAKEQMVPYANLSDSFIAKIDEYAYNVEMKVDELIAGAEANGVNVYMLGSYGYAGIPLTDGSCNHTDTLIDTYLMTGRAKVADYGKTLDVSSYSHENACTDESHKHLSTDGVIDASVGLLPERTWFIKNMGHIEYGRLQDSGKLLVWIATSEEGVDVHTDSRYPQFVSLNRNSGKCSSLTEGVTIPVEEEEKQNVSFLQKLDELLSIIIAFFRAVLAR